MGFLKPPPRWRPSQLVSIVIRNIVLTIVSAFCLAVCLGETPAGKRFLAGIITKELDKRRAARDNVQARVPPRPRARVHGLGCSTHLPTCAHCSHPVGVEIIGDRYDSWRLTQACSICLACAHMRHTVAHGIDSQESAKDARRRAIADQIAERQLQQREAYQRFNVRKLEGNESLDSLPQHEVRDDGSGYHARHAAV